MRKKLIIAYVKGYVGDFREDDETIVASMEQVIKDKKKKYDIVSEGFSSFGFFAKYKIIRWIKKEVKKLKRQGHKQDTIGMMIVGKSMGGVKVKFIVDDYWRFFKNFRKLVLMTIDAHSQIARDVVRFREPHGKDRDLSWNHKWTEAKKNGKLFVYNVYRQDEYPEGAKFEFANINNNVSGIKFSDSSKWKKNRNKKISHWNITDHYIVKDAMRGNIEKAVS